MSYIDKLIQMQEHSAVLHLAKDPSSSLYFKVTSIAMDKRKISLNVSLEIEEAVAIGRMLELFAVSHLSWIIQKILTSFLAKGCDQNTYPCHGTSLENPVCIT